jgi:hypothetical protein
MKTMTIKVLSEQSAHSTEDLLKCYADAIENETGIAPKSLFPFQFENYEISYDSKLNKTLISLHNFYVLYEGDMGTVTLVNNNDEKGWFFAY